MNSASNVIMKKNIAIGVKPKKKSIPININSNPAPGNFLVSNPVNQIASSYLSMGQKIQISKNLKNSKFIHVNTNSAKNYYSINSKDTKPTNAIITNSLVNNYKLNNISDNNGLNLNNYIKNNNYSQHSQQLNEENIGNSIGKNLIRYKNLNINPKHAKNLTAFTNSLLSNDLLINGYQTSKNNNNNSNNSNFVNNSKPKNKIISTNSKSNVSKIRQTYSTRPNFLDSKNKTKKVPMKSKIRQYKYQFKNGKAVSTSFSKVHVIKNNYQEPLNAYNFEKVENNITNGNNRENIFVKNRTNDNFVINNNIYEIKNKHFRHNTASFDNKDIINIFNNQTFSDKNINSTNINYMNNIGIRANRCINNADTKIRYSNLNQNKTTINKNDNNNNSSNINNEYTTNKMNNPNNLKKVPSISNQYTRGRIGDIKIYINEKKLGQKEKYIQNQNINNANVYNINNNIYNKYHTNNLSKDHLNNNNICHIKNAYSISNNIAGLKKISVKQKEIKKSSNNIINNQNKVVHKQIPVQKNKGNIIPSQRNNIKINLSKFLQDVKIKQNNKLVGRKSLSIKRISKENNSDFSLSQLNDKFAQKILKNNDEGNDIDNYIINHKQNINKTIQEEIKENIISNNRNVSQEQHDNNNLNMESNILIDTNYISNMQKKPDINRISSMPTNDIKGQNKINNKDDNNNYQRINYNSNVSINNNHKKDYNTDNNKTDFTKDNDNNKAYVKNKENINNLNINNNENNIDNSNSDQNNKKILNKNIKNEQIINGNNKNQYNITYENNINITKNNNNEITNNKKILDNNINNNLFDEENLNDLPDDYDDKFNDLYSIINKMNFGNVLLCVEGYFTPEGRAYKKYKEKFDKFYEKLFTKKGNSFANSNNKPKKILEGISLTSNTKTCSSSSKKNINAMYNDLNIVKDLNNY